MDDSFDSFDDTFTMFLSSTTPGSGRLLPIKLTYSCRTLNMLASLIYSLVGARVNGGDGGRAGGCCTGGANQESGPIIVSPILRCNFTSPEHFAFTHPEQLLHGCITSRLVMLRVQRG